MIIKITQIIIKIAKKPLKTLKKLPKITDFFQKIFL